MKVDPGSWTGGGATGFAADLVDGGLVDGGLVDDGLLDGALVGGALVDDGGVEGSMLVDPVPPFDPYAPDRRDAVDRIADRLRQVDRAMAGVLRDMATAGPRDGLRVRRQVSLLAEATGSEVALVDRAVQTLSAMPAVQAAFDAGRLSWSQVRGIVCEARRLSVADRHTLDGMLAVRLEGRPGEPDRIVEVAGDLAARIDEQGQERLEAAQDRQQRAVLQPGFDGWGEVHASLAPENFAAVGEALDALADKPVAADAPPVTEDDGRVLPRAARPRVSVIAPLADLLGRADATGGCAECGSGTGSGAAGQGIADQFGSVTARLLLRRGNGRRRMSRALTRAVADDADLVAIFTDEHGMPVAIGDCYAPITEAMRRAVAARDQGCRAPGCSAPIEHCDIHQVIAREDGGLTELLNLVAMCRPCHTRIRLHRWQMHLDPDGTLTTRIGRRTFTTRPRLHDNPAHNQADDPVGGWAGAGAVQAEDIDERRHPSHDHRRPG